jgi:hypothetical protein
MPPEYRLVHYPAKDRDSDTGRVCRCELDILSQWIRVHVREPLVGRPSSTHPLPKTEDTSSPDRRKLKNAPSPSFPTISKQAWRYVSDRTGIIAWANFPIIWLFGMRNNLLMRLTGWEFATFNNFHRWIGRIATLEAVVHSVGYTVIVFRGGGLIP